MSSKMRKPRQTPKYTISKSHSKYNRFLSDKEYEEHQKLIEITNEGMLKFIESILKKTKS